MGKLEGLAAQLGVASGLDGGLRELAADVDQGVAGEKGNLADRAVRKPGFPIEHARDFTRLGTLRFSQRKEEASHALFGSGRHPLPLPLLFPVLPVRRPGSVFAIEALPMFVFWAVLCDFFSFAAGSATNEREEGAGDVGSGVPLIEKALDLGSVGIVGTGFEEILESFENDVGALSFDFFLGGDPGVGDRLPDVALHVLEAVDVTAEDEGNRAPGPPRPSGAPDAVDVVLGVLGEVVVEDDVDVVNVETAGRDISGDKKFHFPFAESSQGALAELLRNVTMQPVGGVAACEECFGTLVDAALGVTEDERKTGLLGVDDAGENLELGAVPDLVVALLDRGNGQ